VIEAPRPFDVKVVPVLGATQGRVTTDVNYLASRLAERLGGRVYQLHAPAFADTHEQRDAIENMGPVKEILNIARQATVALLGVGTVDYETSRFVQFTALSPDDMKHIAEDYHGVGEVSAYVYDVAGCPCAPEYAGRVVGLTLDELMRVPYRIGVAATVAKALAIYGALRGGFLHALITDEVAARAALEHFEREFRPQR
jgi:DNA-binding transcriptional regulator LsrR (DeoR family)